MCRLVLVGSGSSRKPLRSGRYGSGGERGGSRSGLRFGRRSVRGQAAGVAGLTLWAGVDRRRRRGERRSSWTRRWPNATPGWRARAWVRKGDVSRPQSAPMYLVRVSQLYIAKAERQPAPSRGVSQRSCAAAATSWRLWPGTLGRARPELGPDLRSVSHKGYVIFFRYADERFEVVDMLEGHRDIEAFFGDETLGGSFAAWPAAMPRRASAAAPAVLSDPSQPTSWRSPAVSAAPDILSLGVAELAAKTDCGEVSSVGGHAAVLDALDSRGPALNAVARLYPKSAMVAAKAADKAAARGEGWGVARRAARAQGHVPPRRRARPSTAQLFRGQRRSRRR